ncbi:MAG: L,D-transpeptidase [Bradyrhizobiaceae bacterium]|nr:L,D-transpeptidase [Bradyrhizobiaceae bacterium]
MVRRLPVAVAVSAIAVWFYASAQNCERFGWQCPGHSGPRGQPSTSNVGASIRQPDKAAYADSGPRSQPSKSNAGASIGQPDKAAYADVWNEPFKVEAVSLKDIDPAFLRQKVNYFTSEEPGTIVIDTSNHFLYFVEQNGQAVRYGVGVGREGFGWSGIATIHDKREWPDWYPPKEMLEREPEILNKMSELQSGLGVPGGPGNPLGARAMYLWQDNKDTLFRIHGTDEPLSIGKSMSSGCIRMIDQDAIDLYDRAPIGTKVVVQ